jgi:hypothetical protein
MEMTQLFWAATIVMAVVAFGFVALPLLRNKRKNVLLVVAIALPLVAAGLYMTLGSPTANSVGETVSQAAPIKDKLGSVASMVEGLAQRVEEDPNDGENWLLLARSYKYLNRGEEAIDAYGKAAVLGQVDAELAALAELGTSDTTTPSSGAQILGNVSIAATALDVVTPTDTVFIFAKAVDGPPMPIAVLRRPVADLPIDFRLNDSQSMTAGMKLSDFEQVIVTARVTRSGDATVALQGLEANSGLIHVADNQHLNLIIQ